MTMEGRKKTDHRTSGDIELTQDRPVYTPATDIYERPDGILVRCDMPGVDERGLDITLEDNVLSIIGSQGPDTREGYDRLVGEYEAGVYRRAFTLSQDIDDSSIKARIHNGVLDIELRKAEKAQPRKIQVESAT